MTRTLLTKLLVAAAAVVPAVAYLGYAGIQDGGLVQYHVPVDQYLTDSHFKSLHVRLAGRVSTDGLVIGSGRLGAQFRLAGSTGSVPVTYAGVVPDLFKGGCEVLVEGKNGSDGVFHADNVLTKCASKYDAAGNPTGHGAK
jgi:cytochrome c-type biogenesis protein CcmE